MMHFLIVDSNAAFATLLSEELSRLGYDVATCEDGRAALTSAWERRPDVAFLDMALEAPTTLTLAQELRRLDPQVRLVLIPMVGETPELSDDAPEIQGVLAKPFYLPDLPKYLQAALDAPWDGGERPASGEGAVLEHEAAGGGHDGAVDDRVTDRGGAQDVDFGSPVSQATPIRDRTTAPDQVQTAATEGDRVSTKAIDVAALRKDGHEVRAVMGALAAEIGADAVILTSEQGVLALVGGLANDDADAISALVVHGWKTSAEVARILGREQLRFEQSIAGGSYMLYAVSIRDAIMAVAIRGGAPLGLLRHRARATAERISALVA